MGIIITYAYHYQRTNKLMFNQNDRYSHDQKQTQNYLDTFRAGNYKHKLFHLLRKVFKLKY